ncbi:DNA polymerase IV [Pectinatus haikarae]|uniref:DNA polymerase IV n=1 Tax=Pectinatus haikarae TaxID=349096 RepID=A0ABT9Y825_9FIRM|nr:DNA polymerase IV [Pectinatus haikarae]MDQ0203861.1 DNA polymerase-4 [Pectinatus haikarae]
MKRRVMHVDMDAFFASVEQADNPELQGKPIIVGGIGRRGVVCTASYEARGYGVHSAMSGMKARQLCPQGIFLPVRHERYREISDMIFTVFAEFSPLIEPLSIDEAFLDMTGMEKLYSTPQEYASKLKKRILAKTGIHASIGIAPNKFLAKLASDLQKPDGLVIVEEGQVKQFLANLPIGKLWGVGEKTAYRLQSAGYHKIGDIAAADRTALKRMLGEKSAVHLWEMANGIDERKVECRHDVKSVGNEETYEDDIQGPEVVEKHFLAFAETVGWRLRKKGLKAKTVSIKVRTDSFVTYTKSCTLPEGTNFDEKLYEAAVNLFRALKFHGKIRLLGLTGSNFAPIEEQSLFSCDEKQKNLYRTIDDIKAKFGTAAITKAQLLKKNDGAAK